MRRRKPDSLPVHRRTGGLENHTKAIKVLENVHRRTGGLENEPQNCRRRYRVHRRTGGLEIDKLRDTDRYVPFTAVQAA